MITRLFSNKKEIVFDRSYSASIQDVWDAWTQPDQLSQWWGPDKTEIVECTIDARVGGSIYIVMQAGEEMGKYQGTRWPMSGTFNRVDEPSQLSYDARSWTHGEKETTTIEHTNVLTLTADDDQTLLTLRVSITSIGSGAKMAAFGMKWGYKAQLDMLEKHLKK